MLGYLSRGQRNMREHQHEPMIKVASPKKLQSFDGVFGLANGWLGSLLDPHAQHAHPWNTPNIESSMFQMKTSPCWHITCVVASC